ncbi:hypothetical protein F4778DRAFT_751237 [Xylariomycetidae sp. FL2044]|nr:hypothetical protein F4778DRAFT_751237 [Xylariomycetidae sp. FL2044]
MSDDRDEVVEQCVEGPAYEGSRCTIHKELIAQSRHRVDSRDRPHRGTSSSHSPQVLPYNIPARFDESQNSHPSSTESSTAPEASVDACGLTGCHITENPAIGVPGIGSFEEKGPVTENSSCVSGSDDHAYAASVYSGSTEDDMYLFDELPPERPEIDPDHTFAQWSDELTIHTMNSLLDNITPSPTSRKRHRLSPAIEERGKRRRVMMHCLPCEAVMHSSASRYGGEKITMVKTTQPLVSSFACPFYLCNRDRHRSCLTRADLRDVRDLKRHLWASHRQPLYCPTCHCTFKTTKRCDDHIRSRACVPGDRPFPEGISEQQMRQLARRPESRRSEALQWFCVWEIVFPDTPWPTTPFLTGELESVVATTRAFWSKQGQLIVSDFMKAKDLQSYSVPNEERNLAALYSAILNRVVDDLVAAHEQYVQRGIQGPGIPGQVVASLRRLWSRRPS